VLENVERLNDVRSKSFFEVYFRVGEETLSVNSWEKTAALYGEQYGEFTIQNIACVLKILALRFCMLDLPS